MQLDLTTRKLQAVLTAAATTAAMNVTVDYVDITSSALPVAGLTPTNTNGTTPVDILAAPAASTVRKVNSITIYNADTAAKTISVNLDDNGTDYLIIKNTLQVGETLGYTDTRGWYALDANGNTKVSPLTSMTSAQLAALLSDETGDGANVFANNATLTGTTQVAALTASGIATLSAGTVSAPSINFGDSSTGPYRTAANQIGVAISGVKLVEITAAGYAQFAGDFTIYGTSGNHSITVKNGTAEINLQSAGNDAYLNNTGSGSTIIRLGSGYTEVARYTTAGHAVTGAISATTTIKTGGYLVSTLPAGTDGLTAYVTDATAPAYLVALVGGGAVKSGAKYLGAWVSA